MNKQMNEINEINEMNLVCEWVELINGWNGAPPAASQQTHRPSLQLFHSSKIHSTIKVDWSVCFGFSALELLYALFPAVYF